MFRKVKVQFVSVTAWLRRHPKAALLVSGFVFAMVYGTGSLSPASAQALTTDPTNAITLIQGFANVLAVFAILASVVTAYALGGLATWLTKRGKVAAR